MRDRSQVKDEERRRLAADVERFEARGGQVRRAELGRASSVNEYRGNNPLFAGRGRK